MAFNRFNSGDKERSGLSGGLGGLIEAEKLMQVAFVLPAAVCVGWAAGWWLGNELHLKWIEIVGVLFGCVSGLVYVVQLAVAAEKKTTMRDAGGNGAGKGDRR